MVAYSGLTGLVVAAILTFGPSAQASEGLDLLEVVEMTFANDPNISLVESRLISAQGALLSASGAFDPLLSADLTASEAKSPLSESTRRETTTVLSSVGLTQRLRSGLSLEPDFSLERTDNGTSVVNMATVSFTFRQPLMRGRGREVAAAGEMAAEREVEASRLDLEHRVAERLLAVVSQYWTARAAWLNLEVLRATEARSRELLETTRRLIEADVTPAAEMVQLQADLSAREVSRIGGEQSLFQAVQDLGREMGLDSRQIRALSPPGEAFPTVEPAEIPTGEALGTELVARALEDRADLGAAQRRLEAARVLLEAADNGLKPQLDLLLTPSYSGLTEGGDVGEYFSPPFRNIPGISTSFGLRLLWPTRNRSAEGERIQARAEVEQRERAVDLVARAIGADVPTALDAVRRGAEQLARVTEAAGFFEKAVDNEIKKLRAGTSTLIDVLAQRDRLTAVRQQRVSVSWLSPWPCWSCASRPAPWWKALRSSVPLPGST